MQSPNKRGASLDFYTIIAVLPFVAICVIAAFLAAEQARAIALNEVLGRARTAMSAVDSELRGHILTLQALAVSRNLEKGDVRTVYDEWRRVQQSQPAWLNVGLQSGAGTQIFNAVLPFGSPPPAQVDQDSLERALELGTPQIGNVAVGPAIDKAATRVRVPVVTDGKVRYVISVPLRPQLFEGLLVDQHLPATWDIVLSDGNKRLIAAVPPQPPGKALEPAGAAARPKPAKRAPEGFAVVARPDGAEMYAGYVTSALSGWTLTISLPKETIDAAAWKGATPIVVGLMAALIVAIFMVWLSSRRI